MSEFAVFHNAKMKRKTTFFSGVLHMAGGAVADIFVDEYSAVSVYETFEQV